MSSILPVVASGISLAETIFKKFNPESAEKLSKLKIEKIEIASKLRIEKSKRPSEQNDGYVQELLESERVIDEKIVVMQELANVELLKNINSR